MVFADLATFGSGGLVGSIRGLGGSELAALLLVYGVGVASPHVAIGASALAVSVSALTNLGSHARAGVFTLAGIVGAAPGSSVAELVIGRVGIVRDGGRRQGPRRAHPTPAARETSTSEKARRRI